MYLLLSNTGHTYVGATVDLDHRLRQHNGEICGGAKATAKCPGGWQRLCHVAAHVSGFPDWQAALQFEWAWKNWTKKCRGGALERRIRGLCALVNSEKATSKAVAFSLLESPLIFVIESDIVSRLWLQIADKMWDHFIVEVA